MPTHITVTTPLERVFGEFLDRVRRAKSLDEVNVAAGIAYSESRRTTFRRDKKQLKDAA